MSAPTSFVLTLADPAQIVGLSRYSHDRFQSWEPDASRYRKLSGGAEDILMLKPDVVVASLFDKRSTRELLKANGVHVVEFSVPRALDEAKDQIRRMGDIVGHPDRATAEIARLDAAIARARRAATGKHYRVLPLSRRGWVSGSDSLVSSLLGEAGLLNAAGDLGVDFGGYASLEAIVSAGADFILVSDAGDHAEDDGRAFLLHPALQRSLSAEQAHRHPGRADRMRQRAAGRRARCAGAGIAPGRALRPSSAASGSRSNS